MADVKISALPASTTPLAGTEVLPIVQGTTTKQVAVSDLTAGRSVGATSFVPSGSTVPTNGVYLPAANAVALATNSTNRLYIDANGNVNINAATNFNAGNLNLSVNATSGGAALALGAAGTLTSYIYSSAATTTFGTIGAIPLGFLTGNTQKMQISAAGGLSIGNTSDPGAGGLRASGLIFPQQATTAAAPAYQKGAIYFDTTLNKLRVGGATAWETITSV